MNRLDVIQRIINIRNGKNYLEIGVNKGDIIFNVKVSNRIGVDPRFRFSRNRKIKRIFGLSPMSTFQMTSDDFFEKFAPSVIKYGIDVAFVDGLHTYDQAFRDVENCMKYLNPKGVIIMHDCNPLHPAFETPVKNSIDEVLEKAKRGEIPGWTNVWNGDVWKALVHLRVKYPNLEIFTLDLDWGLGIIGNVPGNYDLLEFDARQIAKMNFNDLEANRVRLLNLKPPSYLNIFLEKL